VVMVCPFVCAWSLAKQSASGDAPASWAARTPAIQIDDWAGPIL
jgi:hypothetical protein